MVSFHGMNFISEISSSATSEITLTDPWTSLSSNEFAKPNYGLEGSICVLSGVVSASGDWTSGMVIAKLPLDCRPHADQGELIFGVNHEDSSHLVKVRVLTWWCVL